MSWSLSIHGHDAPSEDVERSAREAFADLVAKAGATGGSLSGPGTLYLSFPTPEDLARDVRPAPGTTEETP